VSEELDAHSVAGYMFQSNALTLKELQSIQSKHCEPITAAERLINIVINQSSNVYGFFLNALKETGQNLAYETIIKSSYTGNNI